MFQDAEFLDALRSLKELNAISCHANFGAIIRDKLGIQDGRDLVVPGEMETRQLPFEAKTEDHYPTEYQRTLNSIQNIASGTVTLVATGVCGKVYCNFLKKAGGIAIDIGAMADFVMGLNTRDLFRKQEFRAQYSHIQVSGLLQ